MGGGLPGAGGAGGGTTVLDNAERQVSFSVNKVMVAESTQQQVYDACAKDIVEAALEGYNGTIMAYGQTGAGKTHTMTGAEGGRAFAERGIVPRAIAHVFEAADAAAAEDRTLRIRVSHMEIYNESVYDLLSFDADKPAALTVQEGSRGTTHVRGLRLVTCDTAEEALAVLFEGESSRAVAEHRLNNASTRSHVIFTLHLESSAAPDADGSAPRTVRSKLHLVDLAGSERLKKTGSTGVTAAEAVYINKSLTFLEQVVLALGKSGASSAAGTHIPYRRTALTNVLKDSLGGNCRTRLLALLWPEDRHLSETVSTLRFASRMMRVKTRPSQNWAESGGGGEATAKLQAEVRLMRRELALYDALAGRSGVRYGPLGPERAELLRREVDAYCRGLTADLAIVSARQVSLCFSLLRDIAIDAARGKHPELAGVQVPPTDFGESVRGARAGWGGGGSAGNGGSDDAEADVLHVEKASVAATRGPGASSSASFQTVDGWGPRAGDASPDPSEAGPRETAGSVASAGVRATDESSARGDARAAPPEDVVAAFADWKANTAEGVSAAKQLAEAKANAKAAQRRSKELVAAVNAAKEEIDTGLKRLKRLAAAKEAAATAAAVDGAPDLDAEMDAAGAAEEEAAAMRDVKAHKRAYRDAFEQLREAKSEAKYLTGIVTRCRADLTRAFDRQWRRDYGVPSGLVEDEPAASLAGSSRAGHSTAAQLARVGSDMSAVTATTAGVAGASTGRMSAARLRSTPVGAAGSVADDTLTVASSAGGGAPVMPVGEAAAFEAARAKAEAASGKRQKAKSSRRPGWNEQSSPTRRGGR